VSHSLPDAWIERLFQKFEDFYGAKWSAQYGDFPRDRVKETWAEGLAGFSDKGEAIAKALNTQSSSPYAPTLPEFLNLCREAARRIVPDVPRLDIKYDASKAKRFADELADVVNSANRGSDPRFWATHPKSHLAFDYIRGAAANNPVVFKPCIDHLIAEGRVSEDGKHLIEKYTGNGAWEKA
jgi:hypothetical protein